MLTESRPATLRSNDSPYGRSYGRRPRFGFRAGDVRSLLAATTAIALVATLVGCAESGRRAVATRADAVEASAGNDVPAADPGSLDCSSAPPLAFVCGSRNPEDLARVPGTRWIVASGFAAGAGLKLVDTKRRSLRRWYEGSAEQLRPDREAFPRCPAPVDPALFNARGLHLRAYGPGRHRLYVVNHGGRESIEVFDVDARGAEPAIAWIGCLPMPAGHAGNSVATAPDGSVFVTVLTRPGTTITDFVLGRVTGGVYEWSRDATEFVLLQGTELPGNNGLELSKDGRRIYVVAFGLRQVVVYDRADTRTPLVRISAPGFMPDNLHWDGERLLAAGMRYDEPACGGVRKIVDGVADMMTCHRGTVVAELLPEAREFRVLFDAPPNERFNAVSAAVAVGDELWMGSFRSDRIAYAKLPGNAGVR